MVLIRARDVYLANNMFLAIIYNLTKLSPHPMISLLRFRLLLIDYVFISSSEVLNRLARYEHHVLCNTLRLVVVVYIPIHVPLSTKPRDCYY